MLALGLIVIGIVMRFLPHAPNFTPVAAIALFGGAYLSKKHSVIVPLLLMIVSDMFIGMHNVIAFTWGSFILVAFLGILIKKNKKVSTVLSASIGSSLLFYMITNFGVWLMGWYPNNPKGLLDSYIMGLPFLRDFTFATIIYSAVFFGAYELIARLVKGTKFSRVLLTD